MIVDDVRELETGVVQGFMDEDSFGETVIVVITPINDQTYYIECDWYNGETRQNQSFAQPQDSIEFENHRLPMSA